MSRKRSAAMIVAVVVLLTGGLLYQQGLLRRWAILVFGPPRVAMNEAYAPRPAGPVIDHGIWDRIVSEHVAEGGFVDYGTLAADSGPLDGYLEQIADVDFDALGRDEKLALLINAYNAFTLRLILDHYDGGRLESIRDIASDERWEARRWRVGAYTWSLNQIENEQIRPNFMEARIHFALVCAAYSCPPLRREAYTGEQVDDQLSDQARECHHGARWFRFDESAGVVHHTELYDWYRDDFVQAAGSVSEYMASYSPPLRRALDAEHEIQLVPIPYSWALNGDRPGVP